MTGGNRRHLNTPAFVTLVLLVACPLCAKESKETEGSNNVFDAPPERVYEAVYRYAQHHGTIKYSDDKHMTVTATIYIPGGKWSYRKDYECTISVQALAANKSEVDVVGLSKTYRTTVSDLKKKNAPPVKVIEGIREELESRK